MMSEHFDEYSTNLQWVLQQADHIVSVLPSTKATRGLLGTDQFRWCSTENGGKCPVFLNVGRGDVVTSSAAILQALDDDCLSAAILDVVEQEPLPSDSPLWTHPRVTISPHVSGLTRATDVPDLVAENYRRYLAKEPLQHVVDWDKEY